MMRKVLALAGVLLAFLVAAHYAHWQWANPGTHSRHRQPAQGSGHGTCGRVASVYHDTHDTGRPTFVDLGHDYPNQDFTIVIWQHDLGRFNPPPESWQDKRVCVTGHVRMHKGVPEIVVHDPGQVHVR